MSRGRLERVGGGGGFPGPSGPATYADEVLASLPESSGARALLRDGCPVQGSPPVGWKAGSGCWPTPETRPARSTHRLVSDPVLIGACGPCCAPSCGRVVLQAAHRGHSTQDLTRPSPTGRGRYGQGRRHVSVRACPAGARAHAAAIDGQSEGLRCRLPPRSLSRQGRVGLGRGLDTPARPASLRQGPARRHQRDPRRTRRGHHHLHPARRHRRHPHCPGTAWASSLPQPNQQAS